MKRTFLLLILCLTAIHGSAHPVLSLRNLNMSQGLNDNFVRSIVRDHYGTMWLLTMNGINRYDGYRVREYAVGGSTFIGDNLHNIFETADSTLWVTADNHLYYYNRTRDRMEVCTAELFARYGIRDSVHRLFVDANRDLWCAAAGNRKLYLYDFRQQKLSTIAQTKGEQVIDVCCRDDEVRVLTSAFSWNDFQFNEHTHTYLDTQARWWLYNVYESRLLQLDEHAQVVKDWSGTSGLQGKRFTHLIDDEDGNLWIGTDDDGVLILDKHGIVHPIITNDIANHINYLYLDQPQNTIWIGTSKQGALYAPLSQTEITVQPMEGMADVSCLAEDATGRLWIGFDGQGMGYMEAGTSSFHSVITHQNIVCTLTDALGRQWWGSYGRELFYRTPNGDIHRINDSRLRYVQAMAEDHQGRLWLATFADGLFALEPNTEHVSEYTTDNTIIQTNSLTDVAMGEDNTLYVGTSVGLYTLDVQGLQMERLTQEYVSALFYADHTLWVGQRNGLLPIRGNNERVKSEKLSALTTHDGLSHNYVRGITEDHSGTIWVSTADGMTSINRHDDTWLCLPYKEADGLEKIVLGNHAILCTSDGEIIAGGIGRLLRVKPEAGTFNIQSPMFNVRFTGLTLGGKRIEVGEPVVDGRVLLQENIMDTQALRLRYNDTGIGLEVSAMDYPNLHHIRYAYRLNSDDAWNAMEGNTVMLWRLPPGTYHLQVKAILSGMESSSATMTIVITPPWWLTWWAYCIYAILAATAIILFFRRRQRHQLQRLEGARERFHEVDVKPSEITVSHVDQQLIEQAIALVEKNISDSEYSVEQFCEDMGMSRSNLYKKLVAITGLSPNHFIRTIRVKRGRQLLEKGGEAISQVAYQIGLSPKMFAKYFKEEYGISPSELDKD